jgi:streptogramin lyase
VGSKPVALTVGEGFVWVANSGDNTVQRLNPKNGERVGDPIQVPGRPAGVAVGAGSVWVTVNDRNELVRIDPR